MERQFITQLSNLVDMYESWREVSDADRLETYIKYSMTKEGSTLYSNAFKRYDMVAELEELTNCIGRTAIEFDTDKLQDLKSELKDLLLDVLDPELFCIIESKFNQYAVENNDDDLEPGLYSEWCRDDTVDRYSNFDMR